MALNLLTLPIELISVIMDGEVLRDLYNLTQTCSRLYHLGRTTRQYWIGAADKGDLPLPTGHTIETVPVEQLISLAARAISLSDAMDNKPTKTKRYFRYASEKRGQDINMLGLPGNAWYIELSNDGTRLDSTMTLKRAEMGWGKISCDLGMSTYIPRFTSIVLGGGEVRLIYCTRDQSALRIWTVNAIKLRFPDERGGPAPPVVIDRQRILLPNRPSDLSVDDQILLASTDDRQRVQIANHKTNLGLILTFPSRDINAAEEYWISTLSIHEKSQKILIKTANSALGERESGTLIHKYHLANIPDNLFDNSQLPETESPDISWTERELEITHSFTVPVWPSKDIPRLPLQLPKGAIYLTKFTFANNAHLDHEDSQVTHFGSLYLCQDRLLAIKTSEIDSSGVDHFARPSGGASIMTGTPLRDPTKLIEVSFLNSAHTRVWRCQLEPPKGIIDIKRYGTEAFNSLHGRMFIKVTRGSAWESSQDVYYAVQY